LEWCVCTFRHTVCPDAFSSEAMNGFVFSFAALRRSVFRKDRRHV
jgi:hypothetical protein